MGTDTKTMIVMWGFIIGFGSLLLGIIAYYVFRGYKDTDKHTSTLQGPDGLSRELSWRIKGLNEVKVDRTERECGGAQVLLIKSLAFRSFYGQGVMTFSDGRMNISAKLGPNEMIIWGIIGTVQLVGLAALFRGNSGIILGGLGMAVFEHVFVKAFSKNHTINVIPQDVASLTRNGPFISIEFKNAVAPGLRKVRFFVSKKFRDDFARDFERMFPGLLK